jgi:dTDP-4-dehydrorhamnose 3,5-epimerase
MKIKETPLKDCYIIEPTIFEDDRGYFLKNSMKRNLKNLPE